jgi:hypothetical protein
VLTNNKKKDRVRLKAELIAAYGGQCACCGEPNPGFLTIDHIFNDGHVERAAFPKGGGSHHLYERLKKRGYPKDRYQLLCFNCNMGKAFNHGVCPHKELK